jgi:hypothetical protein
MTLAALRFLRAWNDAPGFQPSPRTTAIRGTTLLVSGGVAVVSNTKVAPSKVDMMLPILNREHYRGPERHSC